MVRKRAKRLAGAVLAAGVITAMPFQAFAQRSPEFAYSAEKWATLRDNKLEFDEISDLVHEYNPTVVQNEISYKDYLTKNRDDVAQDYYDKANEIYSNINYPDSDDANYGSGVAAALRNEQQAKSLMEQGDENTDDQATMRLQYDQSEAKLAKQAQGLMLTYWTQYYNLDGQKVRIEQAKLSYQSEQNRLAAGMSTQSKVLSAKESVSNAEAALVTAESNLASTKESLCLMLGWGYGADVEIAELAEPDQSKIAAIDVNADIQTALENSYAYRLTKKQLTNARTDSVKEKLSETEKNQRETISNSVKSAYDSLLLAQSSYEQAQSALALQEVSMKSADAKLAAGTITKNTYESQKASYTTAQVTAQTQKLSLLQAMNDYDWAVNGLASAE
ncbi:TolC family protein [Clostridium sp. AM33-3]|uniref:TolC family protein n=1 Tax=Clostridium sp. AM33-3 TaxID=2292304 RepID=UPI000E48FAF7|nr:TolC family protein [Clostridium sp. AM33-3]RHT20699.1 TolC family protein [Clostridium sp. AM33-3]